MIGRANQHVAPGEEHLADQIAMLDRQGGQAELHLVVEHQIANFGRHAVAYIELDLGIARAEFGQQAGQDIGAVGIAGPDRQPPAQNLLKCRDLVARRRQPREDFPSVSEENLARRSQADLAAVTLQKNFVELALERLDLQADRGLGEEELVGGAGKALLAHNLVETAQLIEVHRRSFDCQ